MVLVVVVSLVVSSFVNIMISVSLTKYSYADQLNIQTIADEIMQLPVIEKTREVDWYYMEQFMQGILNVAESTIESLKEFVECTE